MSTVEQDTARTVSAVRGWGSTAQERAAEYPCDHALPDARGFGRQAITFQVTPLAGGGSRLVVKRQRLAEEHSTGAAA
jgi:hypothetical protein